MTPAEIAGLADAVRAGDPRRFAATMAAPAGARPRLWALYALNLEIARAPWASDQPLVAEMRLQWWIDRLEALAAGDPPPAGQPVLAALAASTPEAARLLAALAEARRRDARREGFADPAALWDYLDATSGHLVWAAARSLGAGPGDEAAVRDFAAGAGLAAWLAAWPLLEARGMALAGADDGALAGLARIGLARIGQARRAGLARGLAPALWPGWQARVMLRRAARDPARVRAGALAPSEFRRRGALLWCALSGRW